MANGQSSLRKTTNTGLKLPEFKLDALIEKYHLIINKFPTIDTVKTSITSSSSSTISAITSAIVLLLVVLVVRQRKKKKSFNWLDKIIALPWMSSSNTSSSFNKVKTLSLTSTIDLLQEMIVAIQNIDRQSQAFEKHLRLSLRSALNTPNTLLDEDKSIMSYVESEHSEELSSWFNTLLQKYSLTTADIISSIKKHYEYSPTPNDSENIKYKVATFAEELSTVSHVIPSMLKDVQDSIAELIDITATNTNVDVKSSIASKCTRAPDNCTYEEYTVVLMECYDELVTLPKIVAKEIYAEYVTKKDSSSLYNDILTNSKTLTDIMRIKTDKYFTIANEKAANKLSMTPEEFELAGLYFNTTDNGKELQRSIYDRASEVRVASDIATEDLIKRIKALVFNNNDKDDELNHLASRRATTPSSFKSLPRAV